MDYVTDTHSPAPATCTGHSVWGRQRSKFFLTRKQDEPVFMFLRWL